jgi:hypothetical protein
MEGLFIRILFQVVIVSGAVGVGARRLGYSGFLWFIAQLFGGWFALGMVSALPDRTLEQRRSRELADLQLEMQKARQLASSSTAASSETIGDWKTIRE